jgi:beta-lactamase class A
MSGAVEDALSGPNGIYAIVVKDLNRALTYTRNENHVFATASLYKLWVMIETYQQIAAGRFTEDTRIHRTVEEIDKAVGIVSEPAIRQMGSFDMSMKEALERMITVSHNYAAYLLIHNIGSENLKLFVESNQFTRSNTGLSPKSTASDLAALLEKLYKGELGTPEHTQKMLDLLAAQTRNEIIPKYLPKNVKVMHKTGELGRVKHDVGIVSAPKGDYIIVLMSNTSDRKLAAERLANVSKNVHDVLN